MKDSYGLVGRSIIVLTFLLFLSGCTNMEKSNDITLGVAWPFASDQSLFEKGIDLAVEEINENGGINGHKLKLLKMDDGSEAAKGMAVAQSLSDDQSISAVIGHKSSYVSVPASAIYEESGLAMVSPASTAPELTQQGTMNIFRVIPNDNAIAHSLLEYLADEGLKTIVIYYSDDSYGKGLADTFEDQSKEYGITIADRFSHYSGTAELKRLQRKWRAFGYDGIFIAAAMPEGSQFILDAGKAGIGGVFTAGNALDSRNLSSYVDPLTQDIIVGSVFDPRDNELAENFTKDFWNEYGQEPDNYAALGYDAVKLIAEALRNAKKYDRWSVAEEIRKLGKWTGVCGEHEVSEDGDEIGEMVVLKQLIDGKFSRLER